MLSEVVSSSGYSLLLAQNGKEALEQSRVDVVLLTLMVPERDVIEVLCCTA